MRFTGVSKIHCWNRGYREFGDLFCELTMDGEGVIVSSRLETGKPWVWNRQEYEEAKVWDKFGPSAIQQVVVSHAGAEISSDRALLISGGNFVCEVTPDGYKLVCRG